MECSVLQISLYLVSGSSKTEGLRVESTSKPFYHLLILLISRILGKRVRDAAFFFIIMLVTFAATLLKPQKYVSSRTIQKCVEHVSTST